MSESERTYITQFVGEVPLLVDYKVDWPLLEALADFRNKGKAVFIIYHSELAPRIEEYRQLIQGLDLAQASFSPILKQRRPEPCLYCWECQRQVSPSNSLSMEGMGYQLNFR
ncbi:hypothetical protein CRG98_031492 [Punica granatum]|uniref:Uncharacterized protein n=1 Tax=Punica granatum TaxID=22663 RepID=A0A2I0IWT4_PUNGR|nr:hypothetical protein CRG98_031492 [Punica granatum]